MQLLGVHVGVLGNHDFDFGVNRIVELTSTASLFDGERSSVKWVMSNIEGLDGFPIAGCRSTVLMDWDGVKVALVALYIEFPNRTMRGS